MTANTNTDIELPTERGLLHLLTQYRALTKPRVTHLAIFCAVIGMFLSSAELPPWRVVLVATLGIWLLAGAAFAVNSLIEKHIDQKMARTRMRPKIPELRLALEGRFSEHHALMLEMHLAHVDHLTASIGRIDDQVDEVMSPFGDEAQRLQTIPGVGKRTAEVIVAEIGVDMSRFPTAGHLASWAGMCPGNHQSAGKRRSGKARKGDQALRAALCEAAWAAARTKDTYLSAQFRHLRRRFGKKGDNKAVFAVGHSILVIAWHLLANECDYHDLGGDYFAQRNDADARKRYLIRQLEAMGQRVTVGSAA